MPTRDRRGVDMPEADVGEEPLASGDIAALIERQVSIDPDAVAVTMNGAELSYAELELAATRLAHRLCDCGVGPNARVALCVPRSPALIVSVFAVLKAGGASVPLDLAYPESRIARMLADAAPDVVVTQKTVATKLLGGSWQTIILDHAPSALHDRPDRDPLPVASGADLAYVVFTSGSTGEPKGVCMPRRGLLNLLAWQVNRFARQGRRRTLQFASIGFDVAFQEIVSTLATGGTLVVPSETERRNVDQLARVIALEQIERLFVPPLLLDALADRLLRAPFAQAELADIEVTVAGERLAITPSIRELFRTRPGWVLDNHYGLTETHDASAHRLQGAAETWPEFPPIGKPIANVFLYVLGSDGQPLGPDTDGELFVGGMQVADGYIGQPDQTAARFVDDPFRQAAAAAHHRRVRMYRTGDRGRIRADGEFECLGRVDDQLKIRGFRIEPREVSAALLRQPSVSAAVVVGDGVGTAAARLIAYVVSSPYPGPQALRDHLRALLPHHMVPSLYVPVDELPQTVNGKLDHAALPAAPAARAYRQDDASIEESLRVIWADLLGDQEIESTDDFFELGGHSLLAIEVTEHAAATFGVDLPIDALFSSPTLREFALEVARLREVTRDPRAQD